MSTTATSAVWAYRGGNEFASGYRLVLLRLAEVAHEDGTNAFLGVDTIADDCEMARSTVQRALRWLEGEGMIAVQHPATNRRPTVYRLTIPGLRGVAEPVTVDEPLDGEGPRSAAPKEPTPIRGAALGQRRGSVGAAPMLPDPDPDPDPITHTPPPRARASASKGAGPVGQAIVALWESYRVALTLGPRDSDFIAEVAQYLTVEDVHEAERRTATGQQPGWGLARTILSECAARRRADPHADPWAYRGRGAAVSGPDSGAQGEGGGRAGGPGTNRAVHDDPAVRGSGGRGSGEGGNAPTAAQAGIRTLNPDGSFSVSGRPAQGD